MSTIKIDIVNDRAIARGDGWGPEDWGPILHFGDKLPCCGCKQTTAARFDFSSCSCYCHDGPRAFMRVPFAPPESP